MLAGCLDGMRTADIANGAWICLGLIVLAHVRVCEPDTYEGGQEIDRYVQM